MNQEIFFDNIIEYCNISSQYKIKELSKLINRKKREKYPTKNEVKYGNLSKFLEKEEFEFILSFEVREKIILAYEFMYNMGLRVSEVCEIKETDIIQDQLIIRNIKGNRNDTLPIPLNLLNKLKKHIEKNKRKIRKSDDFIFYSESRSKVRKNISKDWLRNNWRKLVKLAEKQFIYDKSKEIGRKERNLNLYLAGIIEKGRYDISKNLNGSS